MDRRTFLDIMATAPTAVSIVSTVDASGRPRGMTVVAVTSVSAEPPALLICLDERSHTLAEVISAGRFAVNYLRGDRAELAQRFASPVADRFAGVEWRLGTTGMPILHADSLSWLECRTEQIIGWGDHVVLIAAVEGGAPPPPESRPLMYFRHHYEAWPGETRDAAGATTATSSGRASPSVSGNGHVGRAAHRPDRR